MHRKVTSLIDDFEENIIGSKGGHAMFVKSSFDHEHAVCVYNGGADHESIHFCTWYIKFMYLKWISWCSVATVFELCDLTYCYVAERLLLFTLHFIFSIKFNSNLCMSVLRQFRAISSRFIYFLPSLWVFSYFKTRHCGRLE